MANTEQLKILTQGVTVWNLWREEHPTAKIDLTGANLEGKDLRDANFQDGDLRGTSFKRAMLNGVDFSRGKAGITGSIFSKQSAGFAPLWGAMTGLLIVGAGGWEGFVTQSILAKFHLTPPFHVLLLVAGGLSVLFIGLSVLIIRNGNGKIKTVVGMVVLGTALTATWALEGTLVGGFAVLVGGIVVLFGILTMALTVAISGVRFFVAIWVLLGLGLELVGVALAVVVTIAVTGAAVTAVGIVTMTTPGTGAFSGLAALWILSGVLTIAGETWGEVMAVAVISMLDVIIVGLYIGWRTYREDPQFAFLRRIGLRLTTIGGTNFQEADLTQANFCGADLRRSCFEHAVVTETCWQNAKNLHLARLNGTILADRAVRDLLVTGDGEWQSFTGKNLQRTYLVGANLSDTDFRETDLVQANLSDAKLTGAKLYGASYENWIIHGILCDYIFFDEEGQHRTPPDRDFRPGEFEELYAQLPTFEYVFEQGFSAIDAVVMSRVVEMINQQNPGFKLELVNFDKRGAPHATFTVLHHADVEAAQSEVAAIYEQRLTALEAQKDQLMQVIAMLGAGGVTIQSVAGGVNIRQIMTGRDYHEQIAGSAQVYTGGPVGEADRTGL